MNRVEMHREICEHLNKIYEQKNHDYGNSFGETFDKLGIISAVTRISDKYNRLVSLATKPEEERKVKDESITDTLIDMANYCMMTIIEMHKDDTANIDCNHSWIISEKHGDYYMVQCIHCGKTERREVAEVV